MNINQALALNIGDEFLVTTTSKEIADKYKRFIHSTFETKDNIQAWNIKAKFQSITGSKNIICLIGDEKKCHYYAECSILNK